MRKVLLAAVVLFFIISLPFVFSEEKIPYVDIEEAQSQIDELTAENEQMDGQTTELQSENEQLESDIEEWQKQINEIELVLERVRQKGADLYEIYSDIVDKPTKEKANEAISRNRDLRNQLEDKKEVLAKQIEEAQKQKESNNKQVGINNKKIARNTDTINLLTASIEKTRTQTEVLNSYIDTVNDINEEAAKFLSSTEE